MLKKITYSSLCFGLLLAFQGCNSNKSSSTNESDSTEFVDMFDQNSLQGWKGDSTIWKMDNGEFAGSVNNALPANEKQALKDYLALENGDVVMMIADKKAIADVALGAVRKKLGEELGLIDKSKFAFAWITEFPMCEQSGKVGG